MYAVLSALFAYATVFAMSPLVGSGLGAETVPHTLDSLNEEVYAQYAPSLFLRDALFCVYSPNKQAHMCMS